MCLSQSGWKKCCSFCLKEFIGYQIQQCHSSHIDTVAVTGVPTFIRIVATEEK